MQKNELGSEWYRDLLNVHGSAGVKVGSIPYDEKTYWLSSAAEDEASLEEHETFSTKLAGLLEGLRQQEMADLQPLEAPTVVGDFFGQRTEFLDIYPKAFEGREGLFVRVLEIVQAHLRSPGCSRWRVGYFAETDPLVVYPDAIFVGDERFEQPSDLGPMVKVWLATVQHRIEQRANRSGISLDRLKGRP